MRFLPYGILALVSACAADASMMQPSDEDYANVAMSLGSTTAHEGGEVAAMRQAVALARDDDRAGFTRSDDGAFEGKMFGLDFRYGIACGDGGGERSAPCGRTSKGASVEAVWSGTLELPQLAVDIQHDARWELSRMAGSIAHVDGTGHLAYQTRSFGAFYRYDYDATYHVVVNDVRAIGGDIHFDITGEYTGPTNRTYEMTADVTFDPDDTALLVLDGTRRYQILLATGAVTALADD
jgi:hypothetical protein